MEIFVDIEGLVFEKNPMYIVPHPDIENNTETNTETNIDTKSQVKGSQQNNSNTITWDGTEYPVREKKIRRNLYWVVTKVPKDDERWIFSMEEGVTSPVGKVDSQKKCHFFL